MSECRFTGAGAVQAMNRMGERWDEDEDVGTEYVGRYRM